VSPPLDPNKTYQQNILEFGSLTSLDHLPTYWLGLSNQIGNTSSRSEFGHEFNVPFANDMVELLRGGPDFGSLPPFGQDLPEEPTITTINPKQTILGIKDDFAAPPIMFENEIPPQPPTPSFPPMPASLENVLPSPTLQGVDSEKDVDDTFFNPDIDIRENRVVPARPFACAVDCGRLEW
jgi:hypothetical protein